MTEPKTATTPQYKKLSEIAQAYQPEDLLLILDHYEEGLTSEVQALPLGEKFDVRVMERDGQTRKRQVSDELVMLTPESEAWFDRKAQETRQVHLEQRGNIAVNAERILSGQDDFTALFEARRKFMVQKLKEEKKGKGATTGTPTGKKGSSKTSSSKTAKTTQSQAGQTEAASTTTTTKTPETTEA